jgi:4-alpha-glucanotransferase
MAALLRRVDVARIDHFRGFCSCWEVPAESRTAEPGRWVPGPGADLFDTVAAALGRLPFIAEDLGVITDDVRALRRRFDFPGMRILQFAFGGAVEERFLPHNYEANTVVYTGTHDNDTTCGWYAAATATERKSLARYVGEISGAVHWDLIRLGWASVATLALAPVQDVLGLGSDARMNVPGTSSGNWTWRLDPDAPIDDAMNQLRELTETYGRVTEEEPAQDRGRETPNQN